MITKEDIRNLLNAYLEGDHLTIDDEILLNEILGRDQSQDFYLGELEIVVLMINFLDTVQTMDDVQNAKTLMRKFAARLANICID